MNIPDLADITTTDMSPLAVELRTRIGELHPELQLRRGVFNSWLINLLAQVIARERLGIEAYLSARSLKDIQQNKDLADSDTVDGVLSNWGIVRRGGSVASGTLMIVLSRSSDTVVNNGSVFTSGSLRFVTQQVFVGRSNSDSANSSSDRTISQLPDGNYGFTITIVAEQTGASYNIPKDSAIVPTSLPADYVSAYAIADFSGGSYEETTSDLLARQESGIACRSTETWANATSWLRHQPEFETFRSLSLVGAGDSDQLRDRRSIVPISTGGCVDWYIRTAETLTHATTVVTATAVDREGASNIWQFNLGKDEFPGFYEVRRIYRSSHLGSFQIVEDIRGFDLTDEGHLPDIQTAEEAAYTSYQTASIRFSVEEPGVAVGTSQSFQLDLVYLPQIAEIQRMLNLYENRSQTADILVKAPVPCFVTVEVSILKQSFNDAPDPSAIQIAVAQAINRLGFGDSIFTSALQSQISPLLPIGNFVSETQLVGRVRLPSGAEKQLRGNSVLQVPEGCGRMASPRTSQFFVDPQDVVVHVENLTTVVR